MLIIQKHKSVLDKLVSVDVNNLTPIEAINLLNKVKDKSGKQTTPADPF